MKSESFHELWNVYVEDYIRSPKSGVLNEAYEQGRLSYSTNAWRNIYLKYEEIKKQVKKVYFQNASSSIDRHKRAAIITYSIVIVKPFQIQCLNPFDSIFLQLANECIAFYFGLHSLTIDYKPEAIERVLNENNGVFFRFPFTNIPNRPPFPPHDENGYIACVCKDLHFTTEYSNYNILTMANLFFLLELGCCNLLPSELCSDVQPKTGV